MKCKELNELHFSSEMQSLRFISKEITKYWTSNTIYSLYSPCRLLKVTPNWFSKETVAETFFNVVSNVPVAD